MVFEKSLTAMVKGIRANRGKETEYINGCIAEIQKELVSTNLATKSAAVLKLAYLSMLGYDMSWSTFGVVEVMSHNRFATKRPGYLASAMCFNENTDVGLLTINLFKKDFSSKSQYESGLALTCLSSICSADISKAILNDLLTLMSSSRAYLRKKTVLCLFRLFLKDPPALRTAFPKLKERLGDEDQGVLTATVNTFLELARKNAKNYISLVPQLYHILVNTSNNWLTIKLLKLFTLLCPLEPRLPAKMVEPLTNLLNTTKAQSVEFEVIRCVCSTMPEGTAVVALAIERLQNFLNSSDRNLRYLALELLRDILDKPGLKDKIDVADVHSKVLQCIEESDTTARNIALRLLDGIVSPPTFVDTVKKLSEIGKGGGSSADEFASTILRMGARDRYAVVEDFPWYLFVLADMARTVDSVYAAEVAEQFLDITVRVAQVRPCAVTLALSLLDGSLVSDGSANSEVGSAQIAPPMLSACAWVIGEFHGVIDGVEQGDGAAQFLKAAKTLLNPSNTRSAAPSSSAQCIWAATKLYLGAATCAPDAVHDLGALLESSLPGFIESTQVDVSERAALSLQLVKALGASVNDVAGCAALIEEPLLPVHADAQRAVPIPDGLNLDEPFFEAEVAAEAYAPVPTGNSADPYALAACYKDDLGFLAARDKAGKATDASANPHKSSMFYLQPKDESAASDDPAATPGSEGTSAVEAAPSGINSTDPLERMRAQMLASRAGGMKFEVMRDEVRVPGQTASPAAPSGGTSQVANSDESTTLPTPPEKELTDLQGRLWSVCYRDDHAAVYVCVRGKNVKKRQLRVDFRCEATGSGTDAAVVSGLALRLPEGVTAAEADATGVVSLVPGELQGRSTKTKMNLGLAAFAAPAAYCVQCELRYMVAAPGGATSAASNTLDLALPSTSFLTASATTEDLLVEYVSSHRHLLSQQVVQTVSLEFPGADEGSIRGELPLLVGRCAGLCNFFGLQQRAGGNGQKFLLVAQPPTGTAQEPLQGKPPLPPEAKVVCMCAASVSDAAVEVKLSVKSARKDVSEDIAGQLAGTLRELAQGRLKAAPSGSP